MTQQEMDALRQYSAIKTRVAFILQLGYFKASQQIFAFTFDDVRDDVDYILSKYYKTEKSDFKITRQTLSQQKSVILNLFGYQDWSSSPEKSVGQLVKTFQFSD